MKFTELLPAIINVKVTDEDIRRGLRKDCYECPIALALFRETGKIPTVRGAQVCLWDTWYHLPESARAFITAFDHDQHVKPFEFSINLSKDKFCEQDY